MNDDELLRYSRHILLDDIGIEGQNKLLASHALIVGAGGLGSPAALYLAASGIGQITLADDDTVDLTNLQRQIAHTTAQIGQPKTRSAAAAIASLNPTVHVTALQQRMDGASLAALTALRPVDVVLDCSDNYGTRHAINRFCVEHRIPLVSGAAVGFDGQITVIDPRIPDSACYACLFAPDATPAAVACSTMGVFAPLVGIVGAMQAAQAIQCLLGFGTPLVNRLLMLDAKTMQWTPLRTGRDPACSVCQRQSANTTIAPKANQG